MIRGVRGSYTRRRLPHPEDRPVLRKLWRPMIPLWARGAGRLYRLPVLYRAELARSGDNTSPVLAKI